MTRTNFDVSHLSEDELDELLLGIASKDASSHLAACQPCADRFTAFRSQLETQMTAFNQASLAWSEARSNTISRDLAGHKPTPRLTVPALWSAMAALILAVTFGLNASFHHDSGTLEATTASTAQDAVHPEHDQHELASDNAMLAAIDSEIGTPQPTQFGLYQTTATSAEPEQHDAPVQVTD